MPRLDPETLKASSRLSGLLGQAVSSMDRVGGGRNSQVYRVTCGSSEKYIAKLYFRHSGDERARLEVEFSALQFLWANGVRCIPRPIVADRATGWAIYEYIEGETISRQEVTDSDIDYAVGFLARLEGLKSRAGSERLPAASEACFSVQALVENIQLRLGRLGAIARDEEPYLALREFLAKDFIPSFQEMTEWCKMSLGQSGMSYVSELPGEDRTLSPSDFGFHNALRRVDGETVFLDFEYFGWDDPGKTISDFILHPAMDLEEGLKRRFVVQMLGRFKDMRHLRRRVEIVYPLFGLKWCLILLNEFVPQDLLRRGFASRGDLDRGALQIEQLARAQRMLQRIRRDYEKFPYRG